MWKRTRLVTVATKITVDHVCASCAIPLVFQPVKLAIPPRGSAFFGDGCVRLQQPLSPVIRLGAERVFAIGVRCGDKERRKETADDRNPSLAQVLGVAFDVMFLDHLDTDIEHLERLNQLLNHNQINQPGLEGAEKMRPLRTFIITPSVHLSDVAKQHQKDMPSLIHYFVSSLGRDATSCSDLLSYLLFTPKYTRELSLVIMTPANGSRRSKTFSIRPRKETLKTHWLAKQEGMCPTETRQRNGQKLLTAPPLNSLAPKTGFSHDSLFSSLLAAKKGSLVTANRPFLQRLPEWPPPRVPGTSQVPSFVREDSRTALLLLTIGIPPH